MRNAAKEKDKDLAAADQPVATENKIGPAKSRAPKTAARAIGGAVNVQSESEKQKAGAETRSKSEEVPETRSVGGHKFRKQGNAWVDMKFKSSMAVTNVARGSEEFNALDSDLRSIAEKLGGEVIVLRKGKAYRIR
jgi:hypothetical protein